jgi:hypothetical protein
MDISGFDRLAGQALAHLLDCKYRTLVRMDLNRHTSIEDSEMNTILCSFLYEIITPDMFSESRSQSHDRSIVEQKSALLGCIAGTFNPS